MADVKRAEEGGAAPDDHTLGGPEGNERLTGSAGGLLAVLFAVEGLTVLSLQSLLPVHLFVGVLLIPPVLLKIASTGYRFTRYYTGAVAYVKKGPPPVFLRALGPVIVISSVAVLATGVALLATGPGDGPFRGIHKLSFIVLCAAMGVHVLAHARNVPALLAADWRRRTRLSGTAARRGLLATTLAVGLVLGGAAIASDGAWVHRQHHHLRDETRPLDGRLHHSGLHASGIHRRVGAGPTERATRSRRARGSAGAGAMQ